MEGNVNLSPLFVAEMFDLYHLFNVCHGAHSSRRPFFSNILKISLIYLLCCRGSNLLNHDRATRADISTSEHSDPVLIEGGDTILAVLSAAKKMCLFRVLSGSEIEGI